LKTFLGLSLIVFLFAGCSKLDTPFELVFHTSNHQLPKLFIVNNNESAGEVLIAEATPAFDNTSLPRVITHDKTIRIKAVDSKNQVIATLRFDLKSDGSYKSSGGGYLWYEISQPEPYKIRVEFSKLMQ
jgi:hypothetical protein